MKSTAIISLLFVTPFAMSAGLYDKGRVYDVKMTVPEEDWEKLRNEAFFEDIGEIFTDWSWFCETKASPYNYYQGSFEIDGVAFDNVGIRKKGFIGSVINAQNWPSLKVNLHKFLPEEEKTIYYDGSQAVTCEGDFCDTGVTRSYNETKRFTFNNMNQDMTSIRTCFILHIFETLEVPAARCNFARVSVNGVPRGIYSNFEPVKKPLLRRIFGDDSGDLYEGTAADISHGNLILGENNEDMVGLEKKTNEDVVDFTALEAMMDAFAIEDDEEFLRTIEELVDVKAFLRFNMVEAIVDWWDGYGAGSNNYYVYRPNVGNQDIKAQKFYWLPQSPDAGLTRKSGETEEEMEGSKPKRAPQIVNQKSLLIRRLFEIEETKQWYKEELRRLLNEKWDTEALLATFDEFYSLTEEGRQERMDLAAKQFSEENVGEEWAFKEETWEYEHDNVREFIATRKEVLLAELDEETDRPPYPLTVAASKGMCWLLLNWQWYALLAGLCCCGCCSWLAYVCFRCCQMCWCPKRKQGGLNIQGEPTIALPPGPNTMPVAELVQVAPSNEVPQGPQNPVAVGPEPLVA